MEKWAKKLRLQGVALCNLQCTARYKILCTLVVISYADMNIRKYIYLKIMLIDFI